MRPVLMLLEQKLCAVIISHVPVALGGVSFVFVPSITCGGHQLRVDMLLSQCERA